jgi:hypothetical protein
MKAPTIHIEKLVLHLHAAPSPIDLGTLPLQEANASAPPRFELSADGNYVTDHHLKVMWTTDESEKEYTFEGAEKYATDCCVGGFSDWRLPEAHQLQSLRLLTKCNPSIDTNVFKSGSNWVWTNTPVPESSGRVFCVGFIYGDVLNLARHNKAFVRPVRSVLSSQ